MYMIVKVLLWNCDDNGFVNVFELCIWRNSMGLMGRFYGGFTLMYGFK